MDEEQRDEWYVEVPDATEHAPTFTPTITNTPTATATPTSTPTFTATSTPSQTSTPTNTTTPLPTSTFTATSTATNTAVDTATATSTITATASSTGTTTATPEHSSTPSQTASPSQAATSSHTATPSQTATATATNVAPSVSDFIGPSQMCPPSSSTFKADAVDTDGTIDSVWIDFFITGTPDAANPFIMSLESGNTWKLDRTAPSAWSNTSIGYKVTVKDDKGATSEKSGTDFDTPQTC